MKKYIKTLIQCIAVFLAAYLILSAGTWELDPGKWDGFLRGTAVYICAAIAVFVVLFNFNVDES
jgi:hypothetical protein